MRTEELNDFLAKAFEGHNIPETHKKAIRHIYGAYPKECMPQGICDPMYILNVFCMHLGIGDGKSNFYKYEVTQ